MPNDTEINPIIPLALLGGLGAFILLNQPKGGGGSAPSTVCVPTVYLQRLGVFVNPSGQLQATPQMAALGRNPSLWHPTATHRYYTATESQRELFESLPMAEQETMMRWTVEQALDFVIWSVCSSGLCG